MAGKTMTRGIVKRTKLELRIIEVVESDNRTLPQGNKKEPSGNI